MHKMLIGAVALSLTAAGGASAQDYYQNQYQPVPYYLQQQPVYQSQYGDQYQGQYEGQQADQYQGYNEQLPRSGRYYPRHYRYAYRHYPTHYSARARRVCHYSYYGNRVCRYVR